MENNIIGWNNLILGSLNKIDINTSINSSKIVNKIEEGVIEYLDVQEEDTCMVSIIGDKLKNLDKKTGFSQPIHGDLIFSDAIRNAKKRGTDVPLFHYPIIAIYGINRPTPIKRPNQRNRIRRIYL